jgi:hypothetical protein
MFLLGWYCTIDKIKEFGKGWVGQRNLTSGATTFLAVSNVDWTLGCTRTVRIDGMIDDSNGYTADDVTGTITTATVLHASESWHGTYRCRRVFKN